MENKLTNTEIKMALSICSEYDGCYKCPSYKVCGDLGDLTSCALELINEQQASLEEYKQIIIQKEYSMRLVVDDRLQLYDELQEKDAEIERLKDYEELYEDLKVENLETIGCINKAMEQAKAEAIKDLMFNLDNEISTYRSEGKDLNVYAWLKNYAKEMVVKTNEI